MTPYPAAFLAGPHSGRTVRLLLIAFAAWVIASLATTATAGCTYDWNRNGLCDRVKYMIDTPVTSISSARKTAYRSGRFLCESWRTQCAWSVSITRAGSISNSISGSLGSSYEGMISAEVGFSSSQSYSWSITYNDALAGQPGYYYRYVVELHGLKYRGKYYARFFEYLPWAGVGVLPVDVGNYRFGSWSAIRWYDSSQGWKRYRL